jgi:hypothetical protein
MPNANRNGRTLQVLENLSSKGEFLSSILSTIKIANKKSTQQTASGKMTEQNYQRPIQTIFAMVQSV